MGDYEYLLELLEETKDVLGVGDVEQFIRDYKITATPRKGRHPRATNAIIYYTYLKWLLNQVTPREPIHRRHFFRTFSKYFVQGARGTEKRYCVESPYFDKTRKGRLEAKEQTRQERQDDEVKKRQSEERRAKKREILKNKTRIP